MMDEVNATPQIAESMNNTASIEIPLYRCHKDVRALKIAAVNLDTVAINRIRAHELVFDDPRFAPIGVDDSYIQRHKPQPGGYYVVYEDGYKSFSPAKAFEEGYSPAMAGTRFYGDYGTIHQTSILNVEKDAAGDIVSVWFRCCALPFDQTVVHPPRADEMRRMYKEHTTQLFGVQIKSKENQK